MAKPLPVILKAPEISNENDIREELQRKLAQAPVEHAAALLSLYELIQKLHDSGTLDILRGFFGASGNIIERVSSVLTSLDLIRSVRNMIALAQIVGSVDPKVFESLRDAFTETAEKSKETNGKSPHLWTILKRADSENSLRALAAATDLLENFGKRLRARTDGDVHR